ncbi:hypothetical protein FisN_1Hu512 [Fistulifera solaris]|uniref:Mitochondrial splicing suppressor 51-like C-terminal domain-containing protein n=1 Tax=Fistulifera solaris TaxID=1519565 RepID=A0A1Z5JJY0_FISSO|nr:hypothetical protein FisN_1Hu512 [Fistulifera solaris]|eukprot:GAX14313.1 hypothetical protein FisN_1Hu512 [Fistulifera solaris]
MDFLRSCNLDDLPEQQTRTAHLIDANPDFEFSLGFDACCTCGKEVGTAESPAIPCRNCKRVNYCSDACRQQDANVPIVSDSLEEENRDTAMGHSAIICSLLRLCEDDEAVENGEEQSLEQHKVEAARNRIESEKHSYQATLANVLLGETTCYSETLRACSKAGKLILHIIGASLDGELWGDSEKDRAAKAYADALSDLAETCRNETIELYFLGPECPSEVYQQTVSMQSSGGESTTTGTLRLFAIKGLYSADLLKQHDIPKADIVVFFNPGFTVPDYDWKETLNSIENGTPFLSTTNTELEGIADCQYLLDLDRIESIPPGLAQMFDLYSEMDEDGEPNQLSSFFSENPFCGNRVRQNGTMANDVFVKNRWILGGIIGSFDSARGSTATQPAKKIRAVEANMKSGNPALI